MFNKAVIYDWPESQNSMDCVHGEFIESDTFNSSNYRCKKCSEKNDGIMCNDKTAVDDNQS